MRTGYIRGVLLAVVLSAGCDDRDVAYTPPPAPTVAHYVPPSRPTPSPTSAGNAAAPTLAGGRELFEPTPERRPQPATLFDRTQESGRPVQAQWIVTDRAALQADIAQATASRDAAKRSATSLVQQAAWYRQELASVSSLERRLEAARLKGTPQEKVAASSAWNKARIAFQQREAAALAKDAKLASAETLLRAARNALEQFDRDEARRESERRAMAAAERARQVDDDDGFHGPIHPGGTYSSGGGVRVKGYTRKDGSYVPSHTRSRPDGIKSNNRGSRGKR